MRALLPVLLAIGAAGCSNAPTPRPDLPAGSLGGLIRYPSEGAPAMRICALPEVGDGTCISTASGQREYRIGELAAGDYRVVAALSNSDLRVGGHVMSVQCIRAPCPEQLKTVSLPAGTELRGIDINGFYASREDFPTLP